MFIYKLYYIYKLCLIMIQTVIYKVSDVTFTFFHAEGNHDAQRVRKSPRVE